MEEFKQQFIDVAYSEFGIKAIESINFEQAFAILDKMQQLRLGAVVDRSEQLKCEHKYQDNVCDWRGVRKCIICGQMEKAN